ncbi:MAG TPA: hypothetical protein VFS08_10520 [Gemmatimonadaceae bacterium]|nr:hypothetical protein [Gemmatimonadaceae bacterium]
MARQLRQRQSAIPIRHRPRHPERAIGGATIDSVDEEDVMKRNLLMPAAVATAALVGLAACGGNDDEATMDTGMGAAPPPAAAPAPMDTGMGTMDTTRMDTTRTDTTRDTSTTPPPQ